MSESIYINFTADESVSSFFYLLVLDKNMNIISTNYVPINNGICSKYENDKLKLTYDISDYLLIISSSDNVTFMLDNSFIFSNVINHADIHFRSPATDRRLFSPLLEKNTTGPLRNITKYISTGNCSGSAIDGNICIDKSLFIDINIYFNPPPQVNININIPQVTPEVPMDNDTNTILWILIPIIGVVIILVVIIFIVYFIVIKRKEAELVA